LQAERLLNFHEVCKVLDTEMLLALIAQSIKNEYEDKEEFAHESALEL
jgi:hypothetical protein